MPDLTPRRGTTASRDTWLFWIVAVLVIGAGLGLRDPWPADEPRFALVAKQMVESGDWLFPHRGTELYSDKPPMLMWLQSAAYTLLRDWRVAFLLPSLLASLGTLWCLVDLGRRLWTRRVGLYAGWALLFALQFTYQSKKAQIDPLVTFWITLANYGLLRHLLRGPDWKLWWLGWFAAGLGTITKGVGVLALAMLLPAMAATWRGWPGIALHARRWRFWIAPLFFVLAAGLWLLPMLGVALTQPDPEYRAYLDDILFRQTAGRYTKSWDHAQPPWYHLGVILTMWLPAMFALPWALPAWRRRLRRRDPRYLLPLAWWALVVLFFSIPGGKRDVYIMPALPMACLALAPLLPGIVRKAWAKRIGFGFGALLALLLFGAGLAMLLGDPRFEQRLIEQRGFSDGARAAAGLLLAMGSFGLGALLWHRVRNGVVAMLWVLGGIWVLFGLVGGPLFNDATSARAVMAEAGRRIGPDAELGLVAWKEQNLLMADRPAKTWGFVMPPHEQLAAAMPWLREDATRRILVLEAAMEPCIDPARAQLVGTANRRRWWLAGADALVPGCTPQPLKGWRGASDEFD